jgi:hypothetical protein
MVDPIVNVLIITVMLQVLLIGSLYSCMMVIDQRKCGRDV